MGGTVQSLAYEIWKEYYADAEGLQTILGSGATRAGSGFAPLTTPEQIAVERAIVVAVSAAFERYVVELFRITVSRVLGWEGSESDAHLADFTSADLPGDVEKSVAGTGLLLPEVRQKIRGLSWPKRQFANPDSRNVSLLFAVLLTGGEDIWDGVATSGLSEDQVKALVDSHLEDRHDVAHGRTRGPLEAGPIVCTMKAFEEIVRALDECVGQVKSGRKRRPPPSLDPEGGQHVQSTPAD